ncbi:MAG TPA: M20/M25/M40 family metallo-hydrolase, partial [Phototrophicaceae bacterium]|nr:M20/M25/M40 family metallo-hydrolase [Phototrophicaceae bacterium]
MKHFAKTGFLTFVWISLIALACNLGASEPPPPTLAPRIDTQPVATLGVYTPLPGQPDATPTPGIPATPIATKLYTMLSQIDQTRLLFHIDSLEHFHTRHVNSVGKTDGTGITAAFNYINDEFNRIQGLPDSHFVNLGGQPFAMTYNGMTTQQHNAVGVINGTEAGRGVVIVGAHYDSRTDDLTDATSSGPGADDNGSGVAAILELARVMSQYPSRASIIFVLFAGEEEGRYGSKAFVNDYVLANNIPVSVMINLDTIGNVQNAR